MTWKGDHPPRHVHVLRDGRLGPMDGFTTRKLSALIRELEEEGLP
jgi:hypothetical protein